MSGLSLQLIQILATGTDLRLVGERVTAIERSLAFVQGTALLGFYSFLPSFAQFFAMVLLRSLVGDRF